MAAPSTDHVAGLARFARYASPPNQRGYCGPADHAALLRYARTGHVDAALADIATQFDGPLPYLRTLAAAAGVDDPFEDAVVQAYWLGGDLLDAVDPDRFAAEVETTFRGQPTVTWAWVEAALPVGAPTHCWHVLVTYPWLGLLDRAGDTAVDVLDRCRIRAGEVVAVAPDGSASVRTPRLEHRAGRLELGEPRVEVGLRGLAEGVELAVGDAVALHWEWICDRLSESQLADLQRADATQIAVVNDAVMPLLR